MTLPLSAIAQSTVDVSPIVFVGRSLFENSPVTFIAGNCYLIVQEVEN